MTQWLSENDAANTTYYAANFATFKPGASTQLDAAIRKGQSESVPRQNRKLLTYHDTWAYWAREYGWTVIGAIQPSDFAEPSANEVADLIDQVRTMRRFRSSSVARSSLRAYWRR